MRTRRALLREEPGALLPLPHEPPDEDAEHVEHAVAIHVDHDLEELELSASAVRRQRLAIEESAPGFRRRYARDRLVVLPVPTSPHPHPAHRLYRIPSSHSLLTTPRFALSTPTRSAMFDTHEQKGALEDMAIVARGSSRSVSYPTSSGAAPALALRVCETDPAGVSKPRLLDQVREAIREKHYSRRTEKAYVAWIRRYILFHRKRHPREWARPRSRAS